MLCMLCMFSGRRWQCHGHVVHPGMPPRVVEQHLSASAWPGKLSTQTVVHVETLQGSSAGAKRSFLRGKGLTDEEIDEAVKRAAQLPARSAPPDPGSAPPAGPAATTATPAGGPAAQPAASTQQPRAGAQALTVVPTTRSSWLQTSASVALLVCAAYGVSSLALPYAKRCWRYWRGDKGHEEVDMKTYVAQLFARHTERQDEKLQAVADATSSAVQDLKARLAPAHAHVCNVCVMTHCAVGNQNRAEMMPDRRKCGHAMLLHAGS